MKIDARKIQSHNVVAKIDGTDKKDEYVVYTAHWDHLGKDTTLKGDQIYNGALDNAAGGVAARDRESVHEAADAAAPVDPVPLGHRRREGPRRREVLRDASALSAEQDRRGHEHGRHQPVGKNERLHRDRSRQFDARRCAAPTRSRRRSRTVRPDAEPEKGFYYRSDHFEFAKQGVPAMHVDAGIEYIGKPAGYGMQKRDEYTNNDYHKPSDEVKADWDLSGGVQDVQTLFKVGVNVANGDGIPQWKPGTEFKAKRDSMMGAKTDAPKGVELKKP